MLCVKVKNYGTCRNKIPLSQDLRQCRSPKKLQFPVNTWRKAFVCWLSGTYWWGRSLSSTAGRAANGKVLNARAFNVVLIISNASLHRNITLNSIRCTFSHVLLVLQDLSGHNGLFLALFTSFGIIYTVLWTCNEQLRFTVTLIGLYVM